MTVSEQARLTLAGGAAIELPVVVGSENEKGIDIAQLRAKTGYVTLDPAYVNTASFETKTPAARPSPLTSSRSS